MLELNQKLGMDELGWSQSRIDVPEGWSDAVLEMRDGTIFIIIQERVFYLNAENMGALSFEILDGGKKSNQELESIWGEHATGT